MDPTLAIALGATLVPAVSVCLLNLLCPSAPAKRLVWLAATVAPVLVGGYTVLFIAGQWATFGSGQMPGGAGVDPIMLFMASILWFLMGSALVGITLAAGYLVAGIVITSLRRSRT